MPQPVVHFEIPADNPERLTRFYTDLFGWKVEKWSGPVDYWLLYTRDRSTAAIDGGMFKRELPDQRPVNYVHVPSAADYAERARRLGGRVILPRTQVPGIGFVAILSDPEGNNVGLFETRAAPKPKAAARRSPAKRASARKPSAKKKTAKRKAAKKKPARRRSGKKARK